MNRRATVDETSQLPASATIKDVARRARVSLSSVSRVLSEHPDVSQRMRDRVLRAAEALGYEPHFIAQSLRRGSTSTLGFLIGDISNPVFADVIRGAEDYARTKGYAVMLTNSEGEARLDAEYLRLFVRRRVDGIILLTSETGSAEIAEVLITPTLPYVVLDRDIPPVSRASSVYGDHAMGMREATAHLLSRGHQSIALISGFDELRPARERVRGFRQAFDAADIPVREELIRRGPIGPDFGKQETKYLLSMPNPPTAIISGGNRLLAGILDAIREAGRTVGQDLALVSCDDVDLTRLYRPPISVVIRDMYKMGQVACELLVERLGNPDVPIRSVTLPTQFVSRASSEGAWPSGRP